MRIEERALATVSEENLHASDAAHAHGSGPLQALGQSEDRLPTGPDGGALDDHGREGPARARPVDVADDVAEMVGGLTPGAGVEELPGAQGKGGARLAWAAAHELAIESGASQAHLEAELEVGIALHE
jgi:hypothetical protein